MVRDWLARSGVRPVVMRVLARVNPGDIRVQHPYYPRRIRLHSFRHKGYWFFGRDRDRDLADFFARVLEPSDTVVEVGAHIGFQTLLLASLVPEGRVIAFEPGSNNLPYLLENCASVENVEIRVQAVGAHSGRAEFYEEDVTGQNNSLERWGASLAEDVARTSGLTRAQIRATSVDVVTLDQALGGEDVQLVKIKIDGGEGDAVLGALGLLRRCRPTVMVKLFEPDRERILAMLIDQLGFQPFRTNGQRADRSVVAPGEILFFMHPDGPVR